MLSKILQGLPPKRFPFGSRPLNFCSQVVLELVARVELRSVSLSFPLPFTVWRDISKTIELLISCQPQFSPPRDARAQSRRSIPASHGYFPVEPIKQFKSHTETRAAQNINQQPATKRLSRFGLTGDNCSRVLQWWNVLCGIPYRGQELRSAHSVQPYEPASHFPLTGRPNGHREAPLLISNFLRVAQRSQFCKLLRQPP